MQFPRAEVKRDSWNTLDLDVDRAKQMPQNRNKVASTAEQMSPLLPEDASDSQNTPAPPSPAGAKRH